MALSDSTITKLAHALVPEVAEYIMNDERYFDFLLEIVSDAVAEKLKTSDIDLICELSTIVANRLYIQAIK